MLPRGGCGGTVDAVLIVATRNTVIIEIVFLVILLLVVLVVAVIIIIIVQLRFRVFVVFIFRLLIFIFVVVLIVLFFIVRTRIGRAERESRRGGEHQRCCQCRRR